MLPLLSAAVAFALLVTATWWPPFLPAADELLLPLLPFPPVLLLLVLLLPFLPCMALVLLGILLLLAVGGALPQSAAALTGIEGEDGAATDVVAFANSTPTSCPTTCCP